MNRINTLTTCLWAAAALAGGLASPTQAQTSGAMTFFVTSVGKGKGADLGGLDGADAHCQALAKSAGSTLTTWRAYLSTTPVSGVAGVNARDRIGKGPWKNAKGAVVAASVDDLHADTNMLTKATALTEKGETVSGRGDPVNTHDMLTGSDAAGYYSTAAADSTCSNWTNGNGTTIAEGSAIVGHHDRIGISDARQMKTWNSSHPSLGCSPAGLKATGGAGLFYCFAAQ